jgi:uncharacterized membrane protein YfcA
MDPFLSLLLIFGGSFLAGIVGALAGLGGGILIVPMLTLIFGLPFQEAAGASLVAVIATSSGAAAAYVRNKITNIRIGTFLGLATTAGAVCGALLSGLVSSSVLFVLFGIVLIVSIIPQVVKLGEELPSGVHNDRWANIFKFSGSYPDQRLGREVAYEASGTPWALALMYAAGVISGLLGIGSGVFKVLAMDSIMRLPLKVSTTTSNLMIGVTAAASAGIYFAHGQIHPIITAPVALGVLAGAVIGTRILPLLSNRMLRLLFIPLLLAIALQMIVRGLA